MVARRQLHRIAHIAQFARLGLAELHAPRDIAVMHIQARNNSFGHHATIENGAAGHGNSFLASPHQIF